MIQEINIEYKSKELKEYISQFEIYSFITQTCFMTNMHMRQGLRYMKIKSPLRQLSYLVSLFLSTESKNENIYDPSDVNCKNKIETLLEEIELGYRRNYLSNLSNENPSKEYFEKIEVTNPTYLDYFINGVLNFTEQEIDKIQRTFKPFESYIIQKTGLELNDFFKFFEVTEQIEISKIIEYKDLLENPETLKILENVKNNKKDFNPEEFAKLYDSVEKAVHNMRISRKDLEYYFPEDKLKNLINIFSVQRQKNDEYLFYTQECILMKKPVLKLPDDSIIFLFQKQLIHAIYSFLFELCLSMDEHGTKIYKQREMQLEEKTKTTFKDFFGDEAKIFSNYYIRNNEKDLLILYRNSAFIIECKANKYRKPVQNVEQAFTRIKDDFDKCIQKGYGQSFEVKNLFLTNKEINIANVKGKILETIIPQKYRNVYSIIVTQERFGQIQCDLGLLLEINENDCYPWSVYIDDLETFLITLKRKENNFGEFLTYLSNREKLHERLICFDELELVTLFLMSKNVFIRDCNRDEYYISSPDLHLLFDDLYNVGFGFKNERRLEIKLQREDLIVNELTKKLKLKIPENVREYRKGHN